MNKHLLTLAAALSFASINADADTTVLNNAPSNSGSQRMGMQGQHKQMDQKMAVIQPNVQNVMTPVLPASLPSGGVKLYGEFLYWQAEETGLSFGQLCTSNNGFSADSYSNIGSYNQTDLTPDFKWEPGVRVMLGYQFSGFDNWEARAVWTWLGGRGQASPTASYPATIIAPSFLMRSGGSVGFLGSFASSATAAWRQSFNVLDLEFGRSMFLTTNFSMETYGGFRGSLIGDHYNVAFAANVLTSTGSLLPVPTSMNSANHYNSYGIHGGTNWGWHFDEGWNLFGKAAAGLQYGRQSVRQNFTGVFIPPGTVVSAAGVSVVPLGLSNNTSYWRGMFNCEESVGLSWETFFDNQSYHFLLAVAYEMQQWWGYNDLRDGDVAFVTNNTSAIAAAGIYTPQENWTSRRGDLFFQGINVRAQFDF